MRGFAAIALVVGIAAIAAYAARKWVEARDEKQRMLRQRVSQLVRTGMDGSSGRAVQTADLRLGEFGRLSALGTNPLGLFAQPRPVPTPPT